MHSQRASMAWSVLRECALPRDSVAMGAWSLSDPVTLHERVLAYIL